MFPWLVQSINAGGEGVAGTFRRIFAAYITTCYPLLLVCRPRATGFLQGHVIYLAQHAVCSAPARPGQQLCPAVLFVPTTAAQPAAGLQITSTPGYLSRAL